MRLPTPLEALRYQSFAEFEVVVVNGPSTDDTTTVLARWAEGIRIVECPEPRLSKSRNLGIAAARGDKGGDGEQCDDEGYARASHRCTFLWMVDRANPRDYCSAAPQ